MPRIVVCPEKKKAASFSSLYDDQQKVLQTLEFAEEKNGSTSTIGMESTLSPTLFRLRDKKEVEHSSQIQFLSQLNDALNTPPSISDPSATKLNSNPMLQGDPSPVSVLIPSITEYSHQNDSSSLPKCDSITSSSPQIKQQHYSINDVIVNLDTDTVSKRIQTLSNVSSVKQARLQSSYISPIAKARTTLAISNERIAVSKVNAPHPSAHLSPLTMLKSSISREPHIKGNNKYASLLSRLSNRTISISFLTRAYHIDELRFILSVHGIDASRDTKKKCAEILYRLIQKRVIHPSQSNPINPHSTIRIKPTLSFISTTKQTQGRDVVQIGMLLRIEFSIISRHYESREEVAYDVVEKDMTEFSMIQVMGSEIHQLYSPLNTKQISQSAHEVQSPPLSPIIRALKKQLCRINYYSKYNNQLYHSLEHSSIVILPSYLSQALLTAQGVFSSLALEQQYPPHISFDDLKISSIASVQSTHYLTILSNQIIYIHCIQIRTPKRILDRSIISLPWNFTGQPSFLPLSLYQHFTSKEILQKEGSWNGCFGSTSVTRQWKPKVNEIVTLQNSLGIIVDYRVGIIIECADPLAFTIRLLEWVDSSNVVITGELKRIHPWDVFSIIEAGE